MTHGIAMHLRIRRLVIPLAVAIGLYGCTAAVIDQEPDEEPSANPVPSAVAPAAATGEETKPTPAPIKEAALQEAFKVEDLQVEEASGQTGIQIRFSKPVRQYRHFAFTKPPRIVLDVFADVKGSMRKESFGVNTHWVNKLRLSSGKGYLRVVAEIAAGSVPAYVVEPENGGLRIRIGRVDPKATAKRKIQLVKAGKRAVVKVAQAKPSSPAAPKTEEEAPASEAKPTEEKKYTGQKISLDFKDADIKNVFRLLAEVSGLNIVVTDDVTKTVTVRLVDVPWDQALDILLETNGLGKERVGNVLRISSVDRLRAEKDAIRKAKEAEEKLEDLETAFLNVNYAKVKDLETKVKGVLTERGKVFPDERTNTIVIRDIKKALDDATELVNKLDTRTPQVLIESNIIETTPSFARALGFELEFTAPFTDRSTASLVPRGGGLGTSPKTGDETTTTGLFPRGATLDSNAAAESPFSNALGLTFSIIQNRLGAFRNIAATLSAAETEGNIRIISRPSVVTLNNVESTISSLRVLRVALPTGTTNIASGSGSAAGAAVATEQIPVGVTLSVTPQVSQDGFILLKIQVKTSSLGTKSEGAQIPDELTREANSNVLIRDGETVVIGGIMKDTSQEAEGGIPYLKDIPVLGWLFKRIKFNKDFEELMVFITPRTVKAGSADLPSAEQLWRDSLKKTQGG